MDENANTNSGWGALDTLIGTVGQVVSSRNAAQIAADAQNNATAANAVASAQQAKTKDNRLLIYGGLALAGLVVVVLLMRR
jgi:hypothetical protein